MQSVGFEQKLLRFLFHKNNLFIGKKPVVEFISVAINESSDVLCFDPYLIKADRCTDVIFKQTLYCLSVTVKM